MGLCYSLEASVQPGLCRLWAVPGDRGQSPWQGAVPPAHTICGGQSPWQRGAPPAHTICFSACRTLAWDCGGGERAAFLSKSAKGIPLGAPSGRRQKGEGGRQCGSPGQPRGLCGQVSPSQSVSGSQSCLCLAACISVN